MAKILIVDDSKLSRNISRKILEEAGHEVLEAEDGMVALEQYHLNQPDLVLLDITMKGLNGFEVLERLRTIDERARVVIATADVQHSTRVMTEAGGASGYVTKPFIAERVLEAIQSALKEH